VPGSTGFLGRSISIVLQSTWCSHHTLLGDVRPTLAADSSALRGGSSNGGD
jgi:hypothetical protein